MLNLKDSFAIPILPIDAQRAMVAIISSTRSTPMPESLITLKAAVAMQELGGLISVKALRTAIEKGALLAWQPGGPAGTVYVTRASVLTWISKCRVAPNRPTSGSVLPVTRQTASYGNVRSGSSSTADKSAALAAALKSARQLSRRSRST